MFYSHEVLTSRKYGVATVWLVATLGAKSNLKKINRKAILDVDIPKACQMITQPEAPMALRLQSNLLYGVSRVYSQKCFYVLLDAQAAQNNMKALLRVIKTSELDPEAGRARPDQLVLQDDPAFLPEFDLPNLDLDLSLFEASTQGSSHRTSIMSAPSSQSSQSSNKDGDDSLINLVEPTSDSGNVGGSRGFVLAESDGVSVQKGIQTTDLLDDGEGFFPDVDFNFDAEGNLVELGDVQRARAGQSEVGPIRLNSDSAVSGQVRQEHGEGFRAGYQGLGQGGDFDDHNLPNIGDSYGIIPEAEPFPEMVVENQSFLRSSSVVPEEESSESAEAAQVRRRRGPRLLPLDATTELRNSDLVQWNANYTSNMAEATRQKVYHKSIIQARKNAAAWVFGSNISGLSNGWSINNLQGPLDSFAGDQLREALLGTIRDPAGKKRSRTRDDGETSDSEERRMRQRSDGGEHIGRGEGPSLENQDMFPQFDDMAIEIGRHAPPLLEDHSSQMPWNITASLHGSRQGSITHGRGFTSSIGGFPTSAGGPSSIAPFPTGLPGSFDRRASRLPITSASPLVGRGSQRQGSLKLVFSKDEDELLGGELRSDDPALDGFQLYGPAAAVDTQTAAQTQWVKAALDQESTNFLDFVKAELAPAEGGENDDDELGGDQERSVKFHRLLPPSQHTKIVAAQAFHHVLALASKGLLYIDQKISYGPIEMRVAAGA